MEDLLLIGCNGNAWDVIESVHAINSVKATYKLRGFLDDDPEKCGKSVLGVPVLGPLDEFGKYGTCQLMVCIGSWRSVLVRERLVNELDSSGAHFATVIHPSAIVSPTAEIGTGVSIGAYSVVGPFSRIENHVVILSHSVISHDSKVERGSVIAAGVRISGGATVGAGSYVGSHAAIRDHISIGPRAVIGLGAIVVKPVPPACCVVGNPAKSLR